MRQLGKLDSESEVRRFADFLLTQGIKTHVEPDAAGWAIWVYHEDHVARARQEFADFVKDPNDPRYQAATRTAAAARQAAAKKEKEASRLIIDVRQRWQRPSVSQCPLTLALIIACVGVFALENLGEDPQHAFAAKLLIASPTSHWPDLEEVAHGEIWRLLTPILLHGDILHILFNMLWLEALGSAIECARGTWRLLLMVVVIGVTSNLAQYAVSGPNFRGMSGVVYGLFGYILMKSRYEPESGLYMPPNTALWMLGWLVVCWLNLVGPVANTAHVMGLAVGMVIGSFPMVLRRLSRR